MASGLQVVRAELHPSLEEVQGVPDVDQNLAGAEESQRPAENWDKEGILAQELAEEPWRRFHSTFQHVVQKLTHF